MRSLFVSVYVCLCLGCMDSFITGQSITQTPMDGPWFWSARSGFRILFTTFFSLLEGDWCSGFYLDDYGRLLRIYIMSAMPG